MHESRPRPGVRRVVEATAVLALLACTPALNWRESAPDGSGAALMFPCRPERHDRTVRLGTVALPMQLHVCDAAGAVFSLGVLDTEDPTQVAAELGALRAQLGANLGGAPIPEGTLAPAGATPNPESGRVRIVGRRPDGSRVVAHAAFFVKGLRLYQATILGSDDAPGGDAVDTFFGAIRLP